MRVTRLLVVAALFLAACDEDPVRPTLEEAGQLQVRPGLVRTMPGSSTTLEVVAFDDADRPVFPGSVTWSSLDGGIVTVDDGVIAALEPGWGRVVAQTTAGHRDTAWIAVGLDLVGVSVGYEHACGWTEAGQAWCWGAPYAAGRGALGSGAEPSHASPVAVAGGLDFSTVVAGRSHSCGIADGAVYCWGNASAVAGECNVEPSAACHSPVRVPVDGTYEHLAASTLQGATCATGPAGLLCWGPGTQAAAGCTFCWPPTRFEALTGPVALGYVHGCALDGDGRAHCWGSNTSNQLGVDEIPAEYCTTAICNRTDQPIPVNTTARFVDIAAGGYLTCGLTADGEAHCWGAYVGYPDVGPGPTPVAVGGGVRFTTIDAGDRHVCGLASGGQSYCWGYETTSGAMGEISDDDLLVPEPRPLTEGTTFSSLSAGNGTTCAISTEGGAYCAGAGYAVGQGGYVQTASMTAVAPPGPLPAFVPSTY